MGNNDCGNTLGQGYDILVDFAAFFLFLLFKIFATRDSLLSLKDRREVHLEVNIM